MKGKNTGKKALQNPASFGVIDYQTAYLEGERTSKSHGMTKDEAAELEMKIEKAYLNMDVEKVAAEIDKKFKQLRDRGSQPAPDHRETLAFVAKFLDAKPRSNVCFYGMGDKKALVSSFLSKHFENSHVVMTVDGNDPNLTMEVALGKLVHGFATHYFADKDLTATPRKADVLTLAKRLSDLVAEIGHRVILFFNGLDSLTMLTKSSSGALALLSGNELINLVATFDRCDGPLRFGIQHFHKICFVFLELDTFQFFPLGNTTLKSKNVVKAGQSTDTVLGVLESFGPDQQLPHQKPCPVYLRTAHSGRKAKNIGD
jgi:hypothetical protein